ncbi:tripartite tricarboxylate transporter TctB family protein [Natronocalculus amylovorans]|uniref:Tripartite tricarboxylate transporter TctB family protein n=1 Tax=Natronocalculus amylovorans TaxID=2917812 RepID=A0AAE3FX95_9EURY|nr:tripartite tricarboxylate transporter TctB family protein [Natronocalculus amylovorans]MCL9817072.1 tripartite tricarboxylate transporter TctB family protein [Natronocalculus amylovorans]
MDQIKGAAVSVQQSVADVGEIVLRERPTMEHVLLVLFLAAATYMYLGASEFAAAAAVFPRVTAGVTIVLSILLLFRNYLPGPIRSFVAEPMQLGSKEAIMGEDEDDDGDDEPAEESTQQAGAYTYDIDDPRGPAVTGFLCVLYMVLTFTIGMLYATPIFVALYAYWAKMEKFRAISLTILSFVIAYAFYSLITSDIAIGFYTEWRLPVP